MIAILWVMCTGLPIISSSERLVEKVSGSGVSLLPEYFGDPSGISWWFGGQILAEVTLRPLQDVYYYRTFYGFQGRMAIDNSTGHMTIAALREEDSGYYSVQAVVGDATQVTRIHLIVAAHPADVEEGAPGGSVLLTPKYSGAATEVSWWRGSSILARAQLPPSADVAFYGLGGRGAIDPSTGHLTITNLKESDAADYRAEALVNGTIRYTLVKLTMVEWSGLGVVHIVIIVLLAIVTLSTATFIYTRCKKRKTEKPIITRILHAGRQSTEAFLAE